MEVSSLLDGERATMAILVWPQTLPCFFWDISIFRVVSHNHQFFFLARNEYLGVKKFNSPPTKKLQADGDPALPLHDPAHCIDHLSKDLANTSVVCSVLGEAKEVFDLC